MKDRYLLSMPKELKEEITQIAISKGISLNAFILNILWEYLENINKGEWNMKTLKIILVFIFGMLIYLKEVIVTFIMLKLFGFEVALLISLSLIASSISMRKNQSLLSKLFDVVVDEIN